MTEKSSQLGILDEFVDAPLIISNLGLPRFRPEYLSPLSNLRSQINQCHNDSYLTDDFRDMGNLF